MSSDLKVSLITAVLILVILHGSSWLKRYRQYGIIAPLKKLAFRFIKHLPSVKRQLEQARRETRESLTTQLFKHRDNERTLSLPAQGLGVGAIMPKLTRWEVRDADIWGNGRVSAAIFSQNPKKLDLAAKTMMSYLLANSAQPTRHPSVHQIESEIVTMTLKLYNGGEDGVGCLTTCGTESIVLAMYGYRQQGRSRGIQHPEVLAPVTAHAAFDKAAHYFNMDLIRVPTYPETHEVNIFTVETYITRNTVCLVASAPNFSQGTIDDIEELGRIASSRGIGLHVDACMGGFVLPFAKEAGYRLPPADFSVPGVTSVSCDLHKFGFTPKGISCLMWRNVEWRKHSYFTLSNWPGGVYGTPTLIGTRVGAISVGAWSVLLSIGRKGYVKSAKRILGAANYIRTEVSAMTDIHVLGNSQAMITSFGSNTLNIYLIFDAMKSRGWKLIACQNPASFHICLTDCNYKSAPAFVKDLSESVSEVRQGRWPESEGMAAIYGTASKVPDPAVIGELATFYLDCLYEA